MRVVPGPHCTTHTTAITLAVAGLVKAHNIDCSAVLPQPQRSRRKLVSSNGHSRPLCGPRLSKPRHYYALAASDTSDIQILY